MKRKQKILFVLVAFLFATAFTFITDPAAVNVLKWLVYSGGFVVVVSWGTERWKYYQTWTSDAKSAFQYAAAAVISIGGYLLLTYVPASVWVTIDPIVVILLGIAGTYGVGQIAHTVDPLRIKLAAEEVAKTPAPVEVVKS